MYRFNKPLHQFASELDLKVFSRKLFADPFNLYNIVPLLIDTEGNLYQTKNPLIVIDRTPGQPAKLCIYTKSPATRALRIVGQVTAVRDAYDYLPPQYETRPRVDGEGTYQARLDQYLEITRSRFDSPLAVMAGDSLIPHVTLYVNPDYGL